MARKSLRQHEIDHDASRGDRQVTCSVKCRLNPKTHVHAGHVYSNLFPSTPYALLLLASKHSKVPEALHHKIWLDRAGLLSEDLLILCDSTKNQ